MSITVWIIIGGLAGWAASALMKTESGLIRNIIVGVLGAVVGGFLMSLIGAEGFMGFNVWSFLVALLGSVVVLGAVNILAKK